MSARNPGPYIQLSPLGFPTYKKKIVKDWTARQLFKQNEVNTRVYKYV